MPTYPSLKVWVKTTLVKNPINMAVVCATNATVVFLTEYSVLDFCFTLHESFLFGYNTL